MEKSKVLIQFLLIFRQSGDVLFFLYARRLRGYTATIFLSNGPFPTFFLPNVCQLRSRHIGKYVHAIEREIIFSPNCSKFVAECDWNSKSSQNVRKLGLFWKNRWVFRKKNLKFFKIPKSGKFAVECVSNGIISLKCHLRPNYEVFLAQSQKTLNVGKISKYDEKRVFFQEKKCFHFFDSLLYKNGKAQNMRLVADRLVLLSLKCYWLHLVWTFPSLCPIRPSVLKVHLCSSVSQIIVLFDLVRTMEI